MVPPAAPATTSRRPPTRFEFVDAPPGKHDWCATYNSAYANLLRAALVDGRVEGRGSMHETANQREGFTLRLDRGCGAV